MFRHFRRFYLYRLRGYTLLELLSVVAILGTLAGISVPLYSNYIYKARMTKVIAEIRTLEKEILTFQSTAERFPNSLLEIGVNNVLDPWGNPYQYCDHGTTHPGEWRKYKATVPISDDFDLYSMGQDGKTAVAITSKDGRDDIIRADNGRYVGPALDF